MDYIDTIGEGAIDPLYSYWTLLGPIVYCAAQCCSVLFHQQALASADTWKNTARVACAEWLLPGSLAHANHKYGINSVAIHPKKGQ